MRLRIHAFYWVVIGVILIAILADNRGDCSTQGSPDTAKKPARGHPDESGLSSYPSKIRPDSPGRVHPNPDRLTLPSTVLIHVSPDKVLKSDFGLAETFIAKSGIQADKVALIEEKLLFTLEELQILEVQHSDLVVDDQSGDRHFLIEAFPEESRILFADFYSDLSSFVDDGSAPVIYAAFRKLVHDSGDEERILYLRYDEAPDGSAVATSLVRRYPGRTEGQLAESRVMDRDIIAYRYRLLFQEASSKPE